MTAKRFAVGLTAKYVGRMFGHCSTAECKGSGGACDGTEELESARWDDNVRSSSTLIVQRQLSENCSTLPDLMFATKCLSYKLASPTFADLTRAMKVMWYLKRTREANLYLTILALKPNDLNKTLKTRHEMLHWSISPGEWMSRTGTVALSSGESELYAPGALSAELNFAQAILKEIGLSFLIHARADSSTARAVATKQGASRKMKHIHTRFLFIQDLVLRKLSTMSSVKTYVNPSDIGTKALGRERFHRLRTNAWYGNRADWDEFTWQMVQLRRMISKVNCKSMDTSMMNWTSRTIDTCEHA